MDVAAILPWLALVVALNTLITALLAVLIIRSELGSWRVDPGRRATAALRVRSGPAPTGAPLRAAPGRAVGPGPAVTTGESDPLAGAIAAFLGRSDGLFRAGGPPPGQLTAPVAPSAREAAGPFARPSTSTPAPASTPASASGPAPSVAPQPESRPPIVVAHDRPLSEVTWATSRPSRFVPSGPRPSEGRGDPEGGGDPTFDAAPSSAPAAAGPIGSAAASGPSVRASAGRSVSRVSIALSSRDGSGAGAGAGAVARLGPVIGGFIRERTRANDSVTGLTGGRYSIVLPDTSLDGAAALTQRLAQSCDAWLAAEQPPLRLEFGWIDLPADALAGGPAPARASGPERRRAVPQDV